MRRLLFALSLCCAVPAAAWEARIGAICTLTHDADEARVALTYDPSGPLYSITVSRRDGPWAAAPVFAMRFDGPRGLTISTGRHVLGDGGASLTVTDTGFGNVLDGLQFNDSATAFTEGQSVTIPLEGAGPEVEKFRACAEAGLV